MGTFTGFVTTAPQALDLCTPKRSKKFLQSLIGAKKPVALDGYVMPCDVQGFLSFSQSCTTPVWVQIPVSRVRQLEWLGHGTNTELNVERVRLTL